MAYGFSHVLNGAFEGAVARGCRTNLHRSAERGLTLVAAVPVSLA